MKFRPHEESDYIRFFHIYLYRPIVYLILISLMLVLFVLFHEDIGMLWYTLIDKNRSIPSYVYNDPSLAKYQGQLKLVDAAGTILYEGMFENGACNGLGIVYDEEGYRIYEGMLIHNVMQDTNGTFYYKDGTVSYTGEVQENKKQGKGQEFYPDGKLCYEGDFSHDEYEGTGIQYDEDGNTEYEGGFVDGKRHGEGILYEKGANTRKRYSGAFAFGYPQGEGTFYDTFGNAYFKGSAYEGHINYTSLLPGTLEDVEEHFRIPYDIYVYDDTTTAVVFKYLKLAFVSKDTIPLLQEEETKKWKLAEDLKKKEVVFDRIILADDNIDDPNTEFNMKAILPTWQAKYGFYEEEVLMDSDDILAIALSDNKKFVDQHSAVGLTKIGNGLYKLDYSMASNLSRRIVYTVDHMEIIYGFPIYEDELLYSVMRNGSDKKEQNDTIEKVRK